jgi:hypothetical protein
VARSVEVGVGVCVLLLVAGCSTTQQKSGRAQVQAERLLATRQAVKVTTSSPSVRVERVSVLRGRHRTAIGVLLRNAGSVAVSDLPILLRAGSHQVNRRGAYFSNHTPAIAAGAENTWVFITRARVRGRVSARVGAHPAVSAHPGQLPALTSRGSTVTNGSSVPQYGLAVYAYAWRGSRLVAAGRGWLSRLGPGQSSRVPLRVIGSTAVQLEAPPTIFK